MMTTVKNIVWICPIFLFATSIAFNSCKKTQLELLPRASTNGSNTIGCLIDGKAFVGADSHDLFNPLKGIDGYYSYATSLSVEGTASSNYITTFVSVNVNSPLSAKSFPVGGTFKQFVVYKLLRYGKWRLYH